MLKSSVSPSRDSDSRYKLVPELVGLRFGLHCCGCGIRGFDHRSAYRPAHVRSVDERVDNNFRCDGINLLR